MVEGDYSCGRGSIWKSKIRKLLLNVGCCICLSAHRSDSPLFVWHFSLEGGQVAHLCDICMPPVGCSFRVLFYWRHRIVTPESRLQEQEKEREGSGAFQVALFVQFFFVPCPNSWMLVLRARERAGVKRVHVGRCRCAVFCPLLSLA